MITRNQYLSDPCKAASIPYWKAKSITIPDGMKILHQDEYDDGENQRFVDEPYFRLIHNLKGLAKPVLPQGYSLCTATLSEYATHISSCYEGIGITEEELRSYTLRPVYDAALWLTVKDERTGTIVATGITSWIVRLVRESWNGFRYHKATEEKVLVDMSFLNYCGE